MKIRLSFFLALAGLAMFLAACGSAAGLSAEWVATFPLTSTAFTSGGAMPIKYSCNGENVSPPLAWTEPPAGTQSFALIVEDPDVPSGTWTHWALYNIPASTSSLPEAVPSEEQLADGSQQGINSGKAIGYQGPCPPSGTHRYFFKLYALDTTLDLPSGATSKELVKAMGGHILGYAELMGIYSKQ